MSIDVLPIRLALTAPDGRMGRTVSIAIAEDPRFIIDQNSADIVVDFSVPAALKATLERAVKAKTPVLIGTTGLDDFADQMIADAALHIAILRAANTSLGVAVLCNLVEQAAGLLHDPWDIEIVEMHHRQKADSPSGTALALALAAKAGRGGKGSLEFDRKGTTLTREPGIIGIASLRGGTVVGDHDVVFAGKQERLVLSHRAEDRMVFARGALTGAHFLYRKPAGLYDMQDVVQSL